MSRVPVTMLALAALAVSAGAAAGEVQTRAESLARLRAEVETLSSELEAAKEDERGRLRALEAQKVDLEVQVRREELHLERLVLEEEARHAQLETASQGDPELEGAVRSGIDSIRTQVTAGLPYRTEERLEALDELTRKLDEETLPPEQVAARLWAFVEDERRLSRQSALDRQVISLDGQEMLVDVARIGMVALYWCASDGTCGRAAKSGDDWTWQRLEGRDTDQITNLFEQLGRGVHVGWFELPGLVAEVTR